jgi:RNA polymerase sigma-70 factor (ECF subfamily)
MRTRARRQQRHEPDREAFDAESLTELGSVYRTARRLTRNTADAEDLTQETYVRALGAFRSFQRGSNMRAWLLTILRNLNRNRTRNLARSIVVADSMTADLSHAVDFSSETPEARMIREASGRDLRTAIVSLPPALRTAVWMRDIEGLSYAEIARRLEIPVGTVMSRLSSARERVYRRLTGNTKFGGRLRR